MSVPLLNSSERPLLVLQDVHAAYVKKEVLRGISLTVKGGEIVAIFGGNGSGKSTALKTVFGLLRPTRGAVLFDGRDISAEPTQRRQQAGIGYLMQGGRVFPNLTVAENFSIAITHSRRRANRSPQLGSIFPELAHRRSDRAGLLSGGQRQMLAVELVLAQTPRLALLDEPTGALSASLSHSVLAKVREFARQEHCGVLLVEQNVNEAKEVAQRHLFLSDGRISEPLGVNAT